MWKHCDKCIHRGYMKRDKYKVHPFCMNEKHYKEGHKEYMCCMAIQTEYEGECPYKEEKAK